MKIIQPSVVVYYNGSYESSLKFVELAGRTCYKSEHRINDSSAEKFIKNIIDANHNSVVEHAGFSVRFICDRGVSHELVRHRLCSFSQESSRYCRYDSDKFDNEVSFIAPNWFVDGSSDREKLWLDAMQHAETSYLDMLSLGMSAQDARAVLPNSLKTELVVTANIREWRTVFSQRVSLAAHPQAIQVVAPVLGRVIADMPVFFDDMASLYQDAYQHFESKGWPFATVDIERK